LISGASLRIALGWVKLSGFKDRRVIDHPSGDLMHR
jgi:hypothetical protein